VGQMIEMYQIDKHVYAKGTVQVRGGGVRRAQAVSGVP
jgi:hypothetical protein